MENKALKKYNRGITVACAIAFIGVCVALFYNFVFHTGKIGLCSGMVFFAVAAIVQLVLLKVYKKRIITFDLSDEEKNALLRSAMRKNELAYGVIIALFAATLPLTMCMGLSDALDLYEWGYIVKYYLIAAVILYWGFIVLKYRWKSGIGDVIETETDKRVYHNMGIAVKSSIYLLIIVALNLHICNTITDRMLESFAGTTFNDYTSFAEYIETESPSPEDWYLYEFDLDKDIKLKDTEGNVLIDCVKNNGSVMKVYYGEWTDNYLPIKVLTYDDYDRYHAVATVIYGATVALSVAEAGIAVFRYSKKRIKKVDLILQTENSGEKPETIEKPME